MDERSRILEAGTALLTSSPDGTLSVRALCEAAQVSPATVNRHFADMPDLISAIVEHAFASYLASRPAPATSPDPAQDIRDHWDDHVAFALGNANVYRSMFMPGVRAPGAVREMMQRLLLGLLARCADAGLLAMDRNAAARLILATNTGVAISLATQEAHARDVSWSHEARDALLDSITATGSG
ncbi:TetR/AcrR family transcriptional regulator [Georgenia alba]|uniref:TetR/AcrR family transcriptional regulator n=1 Tax=Georgenia alba TaxID=2233858 RepID=A0ABW2Q385_9MICO